MARPVRPGPDGAHAAEVVGKVDDLLLDPSTWWSRFAQMTIWLPQSGRLKEGPPPNSLLHADRTPVPRPVSSHSGQERISAGQNACQRGDLNSYSPPPRGFIVGPELWLRAA